MSEERQETVADIVAAMRDESHAGDASFLEWVGSKMRSYADRIEAAEKREREAGAEAAQICGEIGEMVGRDAACRKPVTDCHGLNAAAIREALVMVKRLFDGRLMWQPDIRKAHEAVDAALAKPPRNCDIGTAEEQSDRLDAFCLRHKYCSSCPCKYTEKTSCSINWALMPYEEGGAK